MLDASVSVIIPAYNESRRLPDTLKKIHAPLKRMVENFQILVIDDGSRDGTPELVEKLKAEIPELDLIRLPQNRGKGYAVKEGILNAKGKYLLMTDADLSTPIEELQQFLPLLNEGAPIVIGTRKHKGARILQHQPLWRESMGKAFTGISNLILGLRVSDFTCGFKLFEAGAAKDIFSRMMIDRWAFDSELLFLANRLGYALKEIPVTWADSPQTRVRIVQDTIVSFLALLKIRWNYLAGRYDQKS